MSTTVQQSDRGVNRRPRRSNGSSPLASSRDNIGRYLREIAALPLLKAQEELDVTRKLGELRFRLYDLLMSTRLFADSLRQAVEHPGILGEYLKDYMEIARGTKLSDRGLHAEIKRQRTKIHSLLNVQTRIIELRQKLHSNGHGATAAALRRALARRDALLGVLRLSPVALEPMITTLTQVDDQCSMVERVLEREKKRRVSKARNKEYRRLQALLRQLWQNAGFSSLRELHQVVGEICSAQGGIAYYSVQLTEANVRLVVWVAKKNLGRGLEFGDLIAEGNQGLLKAVEYFDYQRGLRFNTFGRHCIQRAINRAVTTNARTVRLPANAHQQLRKIIQASALYFQKFHRWPLPEDIAKDLGISADRIREVLAGAQPLIPLDEPVEGGEITLGSLIPDPDQVSPEEAVERGDKRRELEGYMKGASLTTREEKVLRLRFGLTDGKPLTLEETGLVIGVTKERVRQIQNKGIKRIRRSILQRKLSAAADRVWFKKRSKKKSVAHSNEEG